MRLFQSLMPACACLQKISFVFGSQQREKFLERPPAVANQPNFHRISQSDAHGIDIDLDGASLARLRQEFDVGKAAAGDQKRVAILHNFLGRQRAEEADSAGRIRAVVRDRGFSKQRFDDGRRKFCGDLFQFGRCPQSATAGQDCDSLSRIQDVGGFLQILIAREPGAFRRNIGHMPGDISLAPSIAFGFDFKLLEVDGNAEVRDAAIGQRGAAGQFRDILHVRRAHAARVVYADVLEQLVELHVLLRARVCEIVKLHARDGEHRLPVQFGVVKAI